MRDDKMKMTHAELTGVLRDQASLFSLGLLEAAEAVAYDAHLKACRACAEEVRACTELVAGVVAVAAEKSLAGLPETLPPPRVKQELMRRIALANGSSADPAVVLRAHEGRWQKILPGVEVKRLFVDPITKSVTSLVRVAADAIYPAHIHRGLEHLYVLNGDIVFDDHTLSSGDYEVRSANSRHSSATTAPGEACLLLVINSGHDEFVRE